MYLTQPHALRTTTGPAVVRELTDRLEVIDALYRFGLGQDLRDVELFRSAFAADAELDFRPVATKFGLPIPLMTGRDTIVDAILDPSVRIATTHVVTNPRIRLDGDTAAFTSLVEAQHVPLDDDTRHFLLKNLYDVEAVRDGDRWVLRRIRIENVWSTGDPKVILGQ